MKRMSQITEKDNLCLIFVTKWFLEFFMAALTKDSGVGTGWGWGFELVAEVVDRGWIVWILCQMRGAIEEKPKQWTELQAGIGCLTQLLRLIDSMSLVSDPTLSEVAEILQGQLYYNGEVLDLGFEGLQSYKEQSIAKSHCIATSIQLAYVLLQMLEKWGKQKGDVYNRGRGKGGRGKGVPEEEGVLDVADVDDEVAVEDEHIIEEQMFTFNKFEAKFTNEDITHTLLVYLARFKELSAENMKRVVSLLHRQAIKAKAGGLFFKVSTLDLFRSILAERKSLLRTQPYKDLVQLINYILRQFFKAAEKEPFLLVETWKHSQDVQVKKGYSRSEQLGIAVACLIENDQ
ncbi:hypothetical protein JB92DRAFT_3246873 [Gautieria morchelliformis]|nr:hypothetical protein JB92DRAFT_3246873 [Gautieria morchelliformis]